MELRTLKYLVAVADRLSFTAAARELNVSQPALSQQIRQLEEGLGIQLFARTPHRVVVTQGGQLVVDHARRILDGTGRLQEAVAAFRGLERGKLRLAVTQSFNALHVTAVLSAFIRQHPAIDVTVLEWANSAIIAGVAEGALDLGVAFGPIEVSVAAQELYQDRLMLACSRQHPFASQPVVPLGSLAGEALALLTADYGTRRALDRFFEVHEVEPQRIIELDTFGSILKLVETGVCVSVMPGSPLDDSPAPSGVIFRTLDPAPPIRSIQLLQQPTAARSPAAAAFASLLQSRFR
ncbi:MAG: LysR family transcriptional regulator [Hyphomonas sp.]|uniref:LysR substrate-binding domain-containing protein n=1 Tax=Hyphomonas sp. TaxID=87 RepID=UPI001D3E7879|nr:LysR substrate-binding domain-containing protein [Hyphomonas sp.]MBA4228553.1 LysR family transcriptional regulator [Hyphomonas sp.]